MGKKSKENKMSVTIDKSTITEVKARLFREAKNKLESWQSWQSHKGLTLGTRKNLNSILSKAHSKSKKAVEKMEEKKNGK